MFTKSDLLRLLDGLVQRRAACNCTLCWGVKGAHVAKKAFDLKVGYAFEVTCVYCVVKG